MIKIFKENDINIDNDVDIDRGDGINSYVVEITRSETTTERIYADSEDEALNIATDLVDNNEIYFEPQFNDIKISIRGSDKEIHI